MHDPSNPQRLVASGYWSESGSGSGTSSVASITPDWPLSALPPVHEDEVHQYPLNVASFPQQSLPTSGGPSAPSAFMFQPQVYQGQIQMVQQPMQNRVLSVGGLPTGLGMVQLEIPEVDGRRHSLSNGEAANMNNFIIRKQRQSSGASNAPRWSSTPYPQAGLSLARVPTNQSQSAAHHQQHRENGHVVGVNSPRPSPHGSNLNLPVMTPRLNPRRASVPVNNGLSLSVFTPPRITRQSQTPSVRSVNGDSPFSKGSRKGLFTQELGAERRAMPDLPVPVQQSNVNGPGVPGPELSQRLSQVQSQSTMTSNGNFAQHPQTPVAELNRVGPLPNPDFSFGRGHNVEEDGLANTNVANSGLGLDTNHLGGQYRDFRGDSIASIATYASEAPTEMSDFGTGIGFLGVPDHYNMDSRRSSA